MINSFIMRLPYLHYLLSTTQLSRNSRLTLTPPYGSVVSTEKNYIINMVGLKGFEPLTLRLSSACSNQLSYRPGNHKKIEFTACEAQMVEVRGFEPLTSCLQSRCSTN